MSNLFFYLPLMYRYHTRERKLFLVPFIMTDFIPPIVLCLSQFNELSFDFIIAFFLSYFAMFSIYEIGYINNDAVAIKKENNPVMRLSETELEYFNYNELKILGVRYSFFCLFMGILLFYYKYNISFLFISNIILLVSYYFHNYFRNNIRYITNTLLNLEKYIIPVLLFPIEYKSFEFLVYFILFPIFRSVTYVMEKGFPKLNIYVFQIIYSILVFIAIFVFVITRKISFFSVISIFCFLFIFYKIIVCIKKIVGDKKYEIYKV